VASSDGDGCCPGLSENGRVYILHTVCQATVTKHSTTRHIHEQTHALSTLLYWKGYPVFVSCAQVVLELKPHIDPVTLCKRFGSVYNGGSTQPAGVPASQTSDIADPVEKRTRTALLHQAVQWQLQQGVKRAISPSTAQREGVRQHKRMGPAQLASNPSMQGSKALERAVTIVTTAALASEPLESPEHTLARLPEGSTERAMFEVLLDAGRKVSECCSTTIQQQCLHQYGCNLYTTTRICWDCKLFTLSGIKVLLKSYQQSATLLHIHYRRYSTDST
jgi:hypothetical protein